MASRLTVFFYILLCLEAGIFLTVLPWVGGGSFWGDNYFLVIAARKAGFVGLQSAVASGWVRGAVTGLGLLNLAMAFWEIFHFNDTVRRLHGADERARAATLNESPAATQVAAPRVAAQLPPNTVRLEDDAARVPQADNLSHHERRDE
jgi:hypothetical protein